MGRATKLSPNKTLVHSIAFHPTKRSSDVRHIRSKKVRRAASGGRSMGGKPGNSRANPCRPRSCSRAPSGGGSGQPYPVYLLAATPEPNQKASDCSSAQGSRPGIAGRLFDGQHFKRESQVNYNLCMALDPEHPDTVIAGMRDLHLDAQRGEKLGEGDEMGRGSGDRPLRSRRSSRTGHSSRLQGTHLHGQRWRLRDEREWNEMGGPQSGAGHRDVLRRGCCAERWTAFRRRGCQDLGTILTENGDPGGFKNALGGDGGWMVYAHGDPVHLYGSHQEMGIWRHDRDQKWLNRSPDAPPSREPGRVSDVHCDAPRGFVRGSSLVRSAYGERTTAATAGVRYLRCWMTALSARFISHARIHAGCTWGRRTAGFSGAWTAGTRGRGTCRGLCCHTR